MIWKQLSTYYFNTVLILLNILITEPALLIISVTLELSEISSPLFVEHFDSEIFFHTLYSEIKIHNITNK